MRKASKRISSTHRLSWSRRYELIKAELIEKEAEIARLKEALKAGR